MPLLVNLSLPFLRPNNSFISCPIQHARSLQSKCWVHYSSSPVLSRRPCFAPDLPQLLALTVLLPLPWWCCFYFGPSDQTWGFVLLGVVFWMENIPQRFGYLIEPLSHPQLVAMFGEVNGELQSWCRKFFTRSGLWEFKDSSYFRLAHFRFALSASGLQLRFLLLPLCLQFSAISPHCHGLLSLWTTKPQ